LAQSHHDSFHPTDPLAAARRLANYWKLRKQVFQERAFLPMDVSGHGALTADDVRILQTGYCINLPRDAQGRCVLYADNSKKRPDVTPSQRTKFFIFQCVMENPTTHTNGFLMLFNISNPFAANYEPNNGKVIRFLLDHCMPVQSIRVHVIHIPVPGTDITPSFIDTGKERGGDCSFRNLLIVLVWIYLIYPILVLLLL
jgi:hypothetical protein